MKRIENDDVKIEILRHANDGKSQKQISEIMGIGKTTIGDFLRRSTHQEWWKNYVPVAAGSKAEPRKHIKRLEGKRFILVAAQNNTYVHNEFLSSLKQAVNFFDAQLIVGTFSYNKNGFQKLEKGDGEWFDPKIKEHILDETVELADGLLWNGELNILPTAVNPLSGLHSYNKSSSGIVPHVKVQVESLPRHKEAEPRFLYTTGCVTQRNYIQKKEGQKASFHHIFGALLVEVDKSGDWFARHLIADSETGEFQDLDVIFTPTGYTTGNRVEAINWGDLHSEKKDDVVYDVSFRKRNSMIDVLKPRYQFLHDVLDFSSRSHWGISDPYFIFKTHVGGKAKVKDNILDVIKTVKSLNRDFCQTVVVESNHDLAFTRWLKTADYKIDPANSVFFLECQLKMYKAMEEDVGNFSIFENVVKELAPSLYGVRFLRTDESFLICNENGDGVECGNHGDLGVNGAKGSALSYQKSGSRVNIGHSHSARYIDGVVQAGHCAKVDEMTYSKGLTSWSHTHIITYPSGKRTLVTLKNGKWRG